MKLLILIYTILAVESTFAVFSFKDVCAQKDLCKFSTNIACQANSIKLCPGGKIINFTKSEQSRIVDAHNKLRNDLATGKVPGYSTAARMGAMTWNDELAAMVDLNIRRCVYEYDRCHNTKNFPMSGQNLDYIQGHELDQFNRTAVLKEFDTMINGWFSENKNANMSMIRSFQNNGKVVTHFTDMSIDKNTRIGCAGVWYPENGIGHVIFGCNYANVTMMGGPVYIDGPIASKCKSGRDTKFPGLCSSNEKY